MNYKAGLNSSGQEFFSVAVKEDSKPTLKVESRPSAREKSRPSLREVKKKPKVFSQNGVTRYKPQSVTRKVRDVEQEAAYGNTSGAVSRGSDSVRKISR